MEVKIWYKDKKFYANAVILLTAIGAFLTGEKTVAMIAAEAVTAILALNNLRWFGKKEEANFGWKAPQVEEPKAE